MFLKYLALNIYIYIFIYLFIFLFFYFWLSRIFVAVEGFSLIVASGGHPLVVASGLLTAVNFIVECRLQ